MATLHRDVRCHQREPNWQPARASDIRSDMGVACRRSGVARVWILQWRDSPRVWRAGPDDRDGVHWWAAAAIAAIYEGTIGASLVASGLLGHAVSDLYHHRVNKVVTRSMAEFRAVLDTLLAAVIIVAVMKTGG